MEKERAAIQQPNFSPAKQRQAAKKLAERFVADAFASRELLCGLIKRIELSKDKRLILRYRFKALEGNRQSRFHKHFQHFDDRRITYNNRDARQPATQFIVIDRQSVRQSTAKAVSRAARLPPARRALPSCAHSSSACQGRGRKALFPARRGF